MARPRYFSVDDIGRSKLARRIEARVVEIDCDDLVTPNRHAAMTHLTRRRPVPIPQAMPWPRFDNVDNSARARLHAAG